MADNSTKFTLKFGGEENDINATTYGLILINNVALLEEANKELQTGAHLEIKVKSERKGSFLVDLGIEPSTIAAVAPLITKENILLVKEVASKVIKTVSEAYDLWKKLKGEKPKEIAEKGENVVIITGDNNTVIYDKSVTNLVTTNKRSQEALANTFSALSKDDKVENFSLLDEKEKPLFLVEINYFSDLTKKLEIVHQKKKILR